MRHAALGSACTSAVRKACQDARPSGRQGAFRPLDPTDALVDADTGNMVRAPEVIR